MQDGLKVAAGERARPLVDLLRLRPTSSTSWMALQGVRDSSFEPLAATGDEDAPIALLLAVCLRGMYDVAHYCLLPVPLD